MEFTMQKISVFCFFQSANRKKYQIEISFLLPQKGFFASFINKKIFIWHLLSFGLGWRVLSISTLWSRLDLVIYENMMDENHALTSCLLFPSQSQDLRRTLWSLKSMYECPYRNPDMRLCRKFLLKFNHRIPQIRWHHYIWIKFK